MELNEEKLTVDDLIKEAANIDSSNAGSKIEAEAVNTEKNFYDGINNSDNINSKENKKEEEQQKTSEQKLKPETVEAAIDIYVALVAALSLLFFGEEPDIPVPLVVLTKSAANIYIEQHPTDINKILDKLFWVLMFSILAIGVTSGAQKKAAKKKNKPFTKGNAFDYINKVNKTKTTNTGCQCPKCQGKNETRGRHHLDCPCDACKLKRMEENLKAQEIEFEEIKTDEA